MGKWKTLKEQLKSTRTQLEKELEMDRVDMLDWVLAYMNTLENEEDKPMNDIIVMCYKDITGQNPSDDEIIKIGINVKELYYHDAMKWDWDDTEVRDNVYRYVRRYVKGAV